MKRNYVQVGVPLVITVVVVLVAVLVFITHTDRAQENRISQARSNVVKVPTVGATVHTSPTAAQVGSTEETAEPTKRSTESATGVSERNVPTVAARNKTAPVSFLDALCSDPDAGIHSGTDVQWSGPRTVDHLGGIYPHILIATVKREGPGRCIDEDPLSDSPPSIFTPARLTIEKVLVSKVDVPPKAEYVQYGGRFGKNTSQDAVPNLEPGERYVLFTTPLTDNEPGLNTRIMKIAWAMRIDEQGRVIEDPGAKAIPKQGEPGAPPVKKPIADVIARLRELGANSEWQPQSERRAP